MRTAWLVMLGWMVIACADAAEYRVETMAEGLDHPWSLAFLPDGGSLVAERSGQLRRIHADGALAAEPIAGMPALFVSGQAGLFQILIAPDFAVTRTVFFSYAHGDSVGNHLRVARARLIGDRLQEVTPIFTAQPAKRGNAHYGGRMAWFDDDSFLVTLGDGFDYREQAQRLDSHLGTIVRIDRDGAAPANNPFVGRAGALPEIYSYGHRNVQGVWFDEQTRFLYAHEHGPRGGDELNAIRSGGNYGWPLASFGIDYTGARVTPFTQYANTIAPLLHWTPSIAPSGMTLYRGALFPHWRGSLFVSALAGKAVRRIALEEGHPTAQETLFTELDVRLRDVVSGPDGALYLLTDQPAPNGRVLRVLPADVP